MRLKENDDARLLLFGEPVVVCVSLCGEKCTLEESLRDGRTVNGCKLAIEVYENDPADVNVRIGRDFFVSTPH